MTEHREIQIDKLLNISKKLVRNYFPNNDLYSLLVLSLITVTNYSRKYTKMSANTRIELAIALVPDLLQSLVQTNVITAETADKLLKEYNDRSADLGNICNSFMYASGGLRVKIKDETSKKSCTVS